MAARCHHVEAETEERLPQGRGRYTRMDCHHLEAEREERPTQMHGCCTRMELSTQMDILYTSPSRNNQSNPLRRAIINQISAAQVMK